MADTRASVSTDAMSSHYTKCPAPAQGTLRSWVDVTLTRIQQPAAWATGSGVTEDAKEDPMIGLWADLEESDLWRCGHADWDSVVDLRRNPADYDPAAFQGIHARYLLVSIGPGLSLLLKMPWPVLRRTRTNSAKPSAGLATFHRRGRWQDRPRPAAEQRRRGHRHQRRV
jgi:hypothetical protein